MPPPDRCHDRRVTPHAFPTLTRECARLTELHGIDANQSLRAFLTSLVGGGRNVDKLIADGIRANRDELVRHQGFPAEITPHQDRLLRLLAHGLDMPDIAATLGLNVETIRSHGKHVRHRLGARTAAHAVALHIIGTELGLITVR